MSTWFLDEAEKAVLMYGFAIAFLSMSGVVVRSDPEISSVVHSIVDSIPVCAIHLRDGLSDLHVSHPAETLL